MGKVTTGHAIRALREQYGYTQAEFARLLGIGLRTLARYETEKPPTAIHGLVNLFGRAWAINRLDLAKQFLNQFQSSMKSFADDVEVVWMNGLRDVLLYKSSLSDTSSIAEELQNKIVYALRRIHEVEKLNIHRPKHELEGIASTLEECEEQLARRDTDRKISAGLYRLFDREGHEESEPFEHLWTMVRRRIQKDYEGLFPAVELLIDEALKNDDLRDIGGVEKSIRSLDEIANVLFFETDRWPDIRQKILRFFGLHIRGEESP
jgi:transcriptional regulator with XRE-family HTH domain